MGMASDASDLPSGWGKHEADEAEVYDWGTAKVPAKGKGGPARTVASRGFSRADSSSAHTDRAAPAASNRLRGMSTALVTTTGARGGKQASESMAQIRHEASQRWPGYPLHELKGAGYNAVQLRTVGHNAADLKTAGFLLEELKAAGFTAHELKQARFRAVELKGVGFHALDLREAKFRAVDLKAAGFSVLQLKEVSHSASEMKAAGYSASDLKAAKYKAGELRDAGYSLIELKQANFKADELRAAGYPAGEPIMVGYTFADLKLGGYPATELLKAAGYSAAELMTLRYTIADLVEGGFGADDLVPLGVPLEEMKLVGYKPSEEDVREHTQKVEVRCGLTLRSETSGGFLGRGGTVLTTVRLNLRLEDIPMSEPDLDELFA